MRRLTVPALMLSLALGACQLPLVEAPALEEPVPATRQSRPAARPTVTPEPAPTSPVTPAPTPTATPLVPMRILQGRVRIDAHYVVAAGGGRIISSNGGALIEANAGTLISDKGLGLIGKVKLISNNGGSLISDKGLGFRLLSAPAIGAMLPVQGMMVVPISLLTGEPLGAPVLTDETGAYAVTVPETVKNNLRLIAAIPGKSAEDPLLLDQRLHYDLVAAPDGAEERLIDEDEAMATRYAQIVFSQLLLLVITRPESEFPALLDKLFPGQVGEADPLRELAIASLRELHGDAVAAGVPEMPAASQEAVALRLANALLATIDLRKLEVVPSLYDLTGFSEYDGWESTKDALPAQWPVLAAMRESFGFLREQVATVMEANGGAFPDTPFLQAANARRSVLGRPAYEIKRPTDFNDFVTTEYLSGVQAEFFTAEETADQIFGSVEANALPSGLITYGVIRAVEFSILRALQQALLIDPEAKANFRAVLRQVAEE